MHFAIFCCNNLKIIFAFVRLGLMLRNLFSEDVGNVYRHQNSKVDTPQPQNKLYHYNSIIAIYYSCYC